MFKHLREWSGVLALLVGLLVWSVQAMGWRGTSVDDRMASVEGRATALEITAAELRTFKSDMERVNRSLLIWMCVTDRQSAVMAQVPCTSMGVDRNGELAP